MIGLLQRVSEASVSMDGLAIARIERGLLVLVGVEKADDERRAGRLLDRLIHYRVFPDQTGRLNLSLKESLIRSEIPCGTGMCRQNQ